MAPLVIAGWAALTGIAALVVDQTLMGGSFTGKAMVAVGWYFSQMGGEVMGWLMSQMPANIATNWSQLTPYMQVANNWIPLNYAFALVTTYWGVWAGITSGRWALKFVPFINAG